MILDGREAPGLTVTREELVRNFGAVIERGHGALFVGAGMSMAADLPSWTELLKKPRREGSVPPAVTDLPLVAEYYTQQVPGGDERLRAHAIEFTAEKAATVHPTRSHELLGLLPVAELWTTNYDDLLERDRSEVTVIANDEDLVGHKGIAGKRVIKMHGGLVVDSEGTPTVAPPVITRRDFESYAKTHPRMWSLLRSTFLTKSMLFLGIGFDDPNLEVMLRLARSLESPRTHFTVMKKPSGAVPERLHSLRVNDLEKSGISVLEVGDYKEIEPLLEELMRRTRPSAVFISGSEQPESLDFTVVSRAIGSRLAELEVELRSLAGPAAGKVCYAFASTRRQHGEGSGAEAIKFYFNSGNAHDRAYDAEAEVVGTRIYTSEADGALREKAVSDCRVLVLIGGGTRTADEVRKAVEVGIPVVPAAATGGYARELWASHTLESSRLPVPESNLSEAERHWQALAEPDVNAVALAVQKLTRWASYLE